MELVPCVVVLSWTQCAHRVTQDKMPGFAFFSNVPVWAYKMRSTQAVPVAQASLRMSSPTGVMGQWHHAQFLEATPGLAAAQGENSLEPSLL